MMTRKILSRYLMTGVPVTKLVKEDVERLKDLKGLCSSM